MTTSAAAMWWDRCSVCLWVQLEAERIGASAGPIAAQEQGTIAALDRAEDRRPVISRLRGPPGWNQAIRAAAVDRAADIRKHANKRVQRGAV